MTSLPTLPDHLRTAPLLTQRPKLSIAVPAPDSVLLEDATPTTPAIAPVEKQPAPAPMPAARPIAHSELFKQAFVEAIIEQPKDATCGDCARAYELGSRLCCAALPPVAFFDPNAQKLVSRDPLVNDDRPACILFTAFDGDL